MMRLLLGAAVLALVAAGCGGRKECKLDDPSTCSSPQVCEVVQGKDKPFCFAPVQVEGRVLDLESGEPIEGAAVTALDENGAPVGSVASSAADGKYTVRVPSERTDDKGAFVARKLTLRASAKDYVTFPSGLRTALPLDTSVATRTAEDKPFVLSNATTDVALNPLPAAEKGHPSIRGTVELAAGQKGVLVIAERDGAPARSTIADDKGAFTLFNAAPGTYTLKAYSKGYNYTPASATVTAGTDTTGIHLAHSTVGTGTVSGFIQIVSGSGVTSVVMAVKSTFDATLGRGEMPPGLRAPPPGTPPNINGNFSIDGVPDGEYAVLAAFENDGMVRDPDPGIAGTTIQYVTIQNGAPTTTFDNFKVTDAIIINGPGATSPIEDVSATPTFRWQKYPSTDHYILDVLDGFGNVLWTQNVPDPSTTAVSVTYGGPALTPDRIYQWRVTAISNRGNPISRSEDLMGVFRVTP